MIFGLGLAGALSTTKTISRAVAYQIFFLRKDILLHHAICSELPSYLSIMSKSGLERPALLCPLSRVERGEGAKDITGHFSPQSVLGRPGAQSAWFCPVLREAAKKPDGILNSRWVLPRPSGKPQKKSAFNR